MVRITCVKKALFPEFLGELDMTIADNDQFGECPKFYVGQEFILKDIDDMPKDFCPWAWGDIQRDVAMIQFGAIPEPIMKNPHSMYSSCAEGLRPVIFRIEKIDP